MSQKIAIAAQYLHVGMKVVFSGSPEDMAARPQAFAPFTITKIEHRLVAKRGTKVWMAIIDIERVERVEDGYSFNHTRQNSFGRDFGEDVTILVEDREPEAEDADEAATPAEPKSFDELSPASQAQIDFIMRALQASGERVGRSTVMGVIVAVAADINGES